MTEFINALYTANPHCFDPPVDEPLDMFKARIVSTNENGGTSIKIEKNRATQSIREFVTGNKFYVTEESTLVQEEPKPVEMDKITGRPRRPRERAVVFYRISWLKADMDKGTRINLCPTLEPLPDEF